MSVEAPSSPDELPIQGAEPVQNAGADPAASPTSAGEVTSERWSFEVVNALANVFHDREEAVGLLTAADWPMNSVPWSGDPTTFWSKVVEHAKHGKLEGGLQAIIDAAVTLYPHNEIFRRYRSPIRTANPAEAEQGSPVETKAIAQTVDLTGVLTLGIVLMLGLAGARVCATRNEPEPWSEGESDARSTSLRSGPTTGASESGAASVGGTKDEPSTSMQGSTTVESTTSDDGEPHPPTLRRKVSCEGTYEPSSTRIEDARCSSINRKRFEKIVTHHAISAERWEFFLDVQGNQILTVRLSDSDTGSMSKRVDFDGLECSLTITKKKKEWHVRLHSCDG